MRRRKSKWQELTVVFNLLSNPCSVVFIMLAEIGPPAWMSTASRFERRVDHTSHGPGAKGLSSCTICRDERGKVRRLLDHFRLFEMGFSKGDARSPSREPGWRPRLESAIGDVAYWSTAVRTVTRALACQSGRSMHERQHRNCSSTARCSEDL